MKTIEQIRDAFHLIHRVATGQSDRAYMSIPADPERDADLIVSAAIDELEALRAERDALQKAADANMALAETLDRTLAATLDERDEAVAVGLAWYGFAAYWCGRLHAQWERDPQRLINALRNERLP